MAAATWSSEETVRRHERASRGGHLGFTQRWLVADVATTADRGQWEGVQQICDPARAAAYMRVAKTGHRSEFRLTPVVCADA